jgi:hypothetical protein
VVGQQQIHPCDEFQEWNSPPTGHSTVAILECHCPIIFQP